ncbi:MAG TPA: tripartite tricarboxylate transporter substrate binding protein [Ramlibacter sp.]|jgi:tripartite-type tricarboxylate transporter receptor subunit TctC|uniref:Bug family tripartite tricarboxylate transporter substrate binding protein n=1 Tax=Ramlibacter sp. TaxID=1917967 RepID=UPI002D50BEC6|nr:tripartite tricarboxylate transporter substrate binding protein [Ramlibacter sp.]HZY20026.1 tripartite tricarboxylate transporter substrate binding protein [Ramlibacter sp.]
MKPSIPTLGRRLALAALLAAGALPGLALAQGGYPAKPVRVIVSFPPGGAADQIARAIAQPLEAALGQPVVVENRSGANGNIAGDYVAKQPADGYTLLMSSGGTVSINPHLYPRMPFDPVKDLVPVAAAARVLVYLEVNPQKVPVASAREFLAYVKANPGRLTYGSPGNGSSPHLAAEMMKASANVYATHIPYRGAAPAMQDLLGGQIDFMFDPGIGLQHVKAGKLKLLAVGSPKRSPQFPDVPTMEEAGLQGFDADTWFGFYAPGGTPPAVITRLNAEINKVLRTPAFAERMNAIGGVPAPMAPQDFAARAQADSARFGSLIRSRNIQGD